MFLYKRKSVFSLVSYLTYREESRCGHRGQQKPFQTSLEKQKTSVGSSYFCRAERLTCHSRGGCVRSWFRRRLRSRSIWRRLCICRTELCFCESLHHCSVLGVTLLAASLLLPTLFGHHKVVAAVVAEDATTESGKKTKSLDSE